MNIQSTRTVEGPLRHEIHQALENSRARITAFALQPVRPMLY